MQSKETRTILITGCSSGIGYACAHGLRERGYRVFASARKPEDAERRSSEGLEALPLDLDDSATIRDTVDCRQWYPGVPDRARTYQEPHPGQ